MDLSSPRGSSINDFISTEDYTLHYASFDQALALVTSFGTGAQMAKLDLKHAFRLCPVSPSDRDLLGMHCQGKFYVDLRLPFGLRSSPFLFNPFQSFSRCLRMDTEEQLCYSSCHALPRRLLYRRSTNFLYLFPTFVARITQLPMLCPVLRCPGFATLPLRRTWNRLQFLPQPRPSGRSPSLPTVPSHRTFHTPCLPSWNSQVHYLLPL